MTDVCDFVYQMQLTSLVSKVGIMLGRPVCDVEEPASHSHHMLMASRFFDNSALLWLHDFSSRSLRDTWFCISEISCAKRDELTSRDYHRHFVCPVGRLTKLR